MLDSLHKAISDKSDDPDLRVIVLRSSGPVFSAGHDLRELVCIIHYHTLGVLALTDNFQVMNNKILTKKFFLLKLLEMSQKMQKCKKKKFLLH